MAGLLLFACADRHHVLLGQDGALGEDRPSGRVPRPPYARTATLPCPWYVFHRPR
jgi:hypothetical protein